MNHSPFLQEACGLGEWQKCTLWELGAVCYCSVTWPSPADTEGMGRSREMAQSKHGKWGSERIEGEKETERRKRLEEIHRKRRSKMEYKREEKRAWWRKTEQGHRGRAGWCSDRWARASARSLKWTANCLILFLLHVQLLMLLPVDLRSAAFLYGEKLKGIWNRVIRPFVKPVCGRKEAAVSCNPAFLLGCLELPSGFQGYLGGCSPSKAWPDKPLPCLAVHLSSCILSDMYSRLSFFFF